MTLFVFHTPLFERRIKKTALTTQSAHMAKAMPITPMENTTLKI
jgi:hypothetical protein